MKEAERIQTTHPVTDGYDDTTGSRAGLDPRYEGYFACFNSQRYFEAHDMLEPLWLEVRNGNRAFYKALIQLAAAFLHLQRQFHRPHHPKDGNRARPAVRLFLLAAGNLAPYRPLHLRLNVESVWRLTNSLAEQITHSDFSNPWSPEDAPAIFLERV